MKNILPIVIFFRMRLKTSVCEANQRKKEKLKLSFENFC